MSVALQKNKTTENEIIIHQRHSTQIKTKTDSPKEESILKEEVKDEKKKQSSIPLFKVNKEKENFNRIIQIKEEDNNKELSKNKVLSSDIKGKSIEDYNSNDLTSLRELIKHNQKTEFSSKEVIPSSNMENKLELGIQKEDENEKEFHNKNINIEIMNSIPQENIVNIENILTKKSSNKINKTCKICLESENDEKEIAFIQLKSNQNQSNKLITPCKCEGTVKFVHSLCVKKSVEVQNKTKCEICKEEYYFRVNCKKDYSKEVLKKKVKNHLINLIIYGIIEFGIGILIYFAVVNLANIQVKENKNMALLIIMFTCGLFFIITCVYYTKKKKFYSVIIENWEVVEYDDFKNSKNKDMKEKFFKIINLNDDYQLDESYVSLDEKLKKIIISINQNVQIFLIK